MSAYDLGCVKTQKFEKRENYFLRLNKNEHAHEFLQL